MTPAATMSATAHLPTVSPMQPSDLQVVAATLHAMAHAADGSDLRAVRAGG